MRPLLLVLLLAACDTQLEVSKPAGDTTRVATDTARHHGNAKGHDKHKRGHDDDHGERDR